MNKIKFFIIRFWVFFRFFTWDMFKVIPTVKKAKKRGLLFDCNVYGDGINRFNCRSFFYHPVHKLRYRCGELEKEE